MNYFCGMSGKKIIAIILILVFSVPLVPVSQVGSLLSSNQLQEEIVHASVGKAIQSQEPDHIHYFAPVTDLQSNFSPVITDEAFTSRQADDIQTPPPNM